MEVSSTFTSTAPAPTSASPGVISSDFETFLKMLTTQMTNQDPLNPIESSDYAVQLATFSGVEQQVMTNELLQGLANQFGLMSMAQLAGWVGHDARAAVPVSFDGDPVTLSPNPVSGANRAVLVIRNAAGELVSREDIPVSTEPYEWMGADFGGDPLPEGRYTLELESYRGEERLAATPVESYARIVEARAGANGVVLLLAGGVEVPADQITGLRDGSAGN